LRAETTTFAPRAPAALAVALPIPLDAPVTTITCSESRFFTDGSSPRFAAEKRWYCEAVPFGIGIWEILILLLVVLLVFGPKRLPEMGRSLGKGLREFKDSIAGKDDDEPVHHRLAQELPPADEQPVAQEQRERDTVS
jgi:sec-independent protein translocase protein TatA